MFSALGFSAASKNAGSIGIANLPGDLQPVRGLVRQRHHPRQRPYADLVRARQRGGDGRSRGRNGARATFRSARTRSSAASNSVRGSGFDDKLFGSDNLDTETFQGLGGNDTIDGNGGFDVADYSPTTGGGISVDLAAGSVTALAAANSGNDSLQPGRGDPRNRVRRHIQRGRLQRGAARTPAISARTTNSKAAAATTPSPATATPPSSFDHANAGVTVNLATGKVTASGANNVGKDTITGGVTRVRGSQFGDIIIGARPAETARRRARQRHADRRWRRGYFRLFDRIERRLYRRRRGHDRGLRNRRRQRSISAAWPTC